MHKHSHCNNRNLARRPRCNQPLVENQSCSVEMTGWQTTDTHKFPQKAHGLIELPEQEKVGWREFTQFLSR